MLRLGVDVTWLARDRRGMGRYLRGVLDALPADVEVTRFSREPSSGEVAWSDPGLDALDACWFPWNRMDVVPRAVRLVTIHDTAAFDWPLRGALAFLENRKAQGRLQRAAGRADRVMTVSGFSRDCIVRHLGVSAQRVDVVAEGVDASFRPLSEGDAEAVRMREGDGRPFALFVGARDERKNLDGLLRAWPLVSRNDVPLLVAGCTGEPLPGVRWLGEVSDDRLRSLYAACAVFVMPTLYEGFGLPLLEAMACGATCAASRIASLPEVGADVPHWFDPHDPTDIARAIRQALAEPRRDQGLVRAASFTWERAAADVVVSVRRALGAR